MGGGGRNSVFGVDAGRSFVDRAPGIRFPVGPGAAGGIRPLCPRLSDATAAGARGLLLRVMRRASCPWQWPASAPINDLVAEIEDLIVCRAVPYYFHRLRAEVMHLHSSAKAIRAPQREFLPIAGHERTIERERDVGRSVHALGQFVARGVGAL